MSPHPSHSSRSPGRRPPPDYFSRRVQTKLLVLVGMFMLVVLLMIEAGKPKNWQWMFAGQRPSAGEDSLRDEVPPEQPPQPFARKPAGPLEVPPGGGPKAASGGPNAASGGPNAASGGSGEEQVTPASLPAGPMGVDDSDPLTRTQIDGWRRVLKELPRDAERTFQRGMQKAREARSLSAEETAEWEALLRQLEQGWDTYHDESLASLAEGAGGLNAEQRERWLGVLHASRGAWRDRYLPALRSLPAGEEAPAEQSQALTELQALLDQLALDRVEDDTVLRLADKDAWFRALDRLRRAAPDAIGRASSGPASYVQLYEQPDVYRGKLVTVRGQARLAYRVPAPENNYGIDHYYIFWLKPAAGPNAPLVVYALETPPGFPAIGDKQSAGETPLSEDVEFTGYFFKRYAYASRGGATTAPLLLARAPAWKRATETSAGESGVGPPSFGFLAMAALVSLAVAGCVTALVYLRGRNSAAGSWYKQSEQGAADRLRDLSRENHPTPIEATLRTLATEQRETGDRQHRAGDR